MGCASGEPRSTDQNALLNWPKRPKTPVLDSRVNVTQPGGGNRDGIDIDSCRDVVVEDSYFASGDDTLCVKSGIDFFGQRYNRPSRDIIFRNITTGGGYGITIGSEVSGGVENVTFEGK
jgi:polygalacturonase